MRTLCLSLSALALTGCGASTPFVDPVTPAALTAPCARPVPLPDTLSDRDVEVFWGRDRNALLNCGAKIDTLAGRTPQPK